MGWCGGNILERRESLKRHIKNGVIETESELRKLFAEYIDFVYNVQPYGGEEKKYKNCTRIDVWNKSIETTGIRMADESTLRLLTMRTNGYQKIKREGVYILLQGQKIWYYDKSVWEHINEEVYVRYDPCDLRTVRIYDKEDRYLWTWGIADYFMLEYLNEDAENIAKAQRLKGDTLKKISDRAKELKGGIKLRRTDGLRYTVLSGRDKFKIKMPRNIQPVIVNEKFAEEKQVAGTDVINVKRMIKNAKRGK